MKGRLQSRPPGGDDDSDAVDEDLFGAIFDSAPIGIAVTARDQRFKRVNRRLCEILGYDADELVGKSFVDVTHPDDVGQSVSQANDAYRQGFAGSRFSKRYLTSSGDVVWAQVTVHAVQGASGPRYVVALIEDVSERHCQEELARSLAKQSDRLAGIIKHSPYFTVFAAEDGSITYLNDAALAMLGLQDSASVIGQSLDLFDLCDAGGGAKPLLEAVREEKSFSDERTFRSAGGRERIEVEVSAFEIAAGGEECSGIAVIARDISLRRDVERQLRSSERRLRRLTRRLLAAQEEERARIARELHDDITQQLSLLAVDIGFLQTEPVTDADDFQAKLQDLQDQAVDLAENVRRLSHQFHPSALSHSDLAEALRQLCAEAQTLHEIEARFIARVDAVELSREKSTVVYRIVQEALRNVAKHAEASGATVILDRDDGGVSVIVLDDGKGFDAEEEGNAQGLGLVSMFERAQLIGGSVEITSAPGEGSRIELRVPHASD